MSISSALTVIASQRGAACIVPAGSLLRIVAVSEKQVADLAIFARNDLRDAYSPGRTIDYNGRLIPAIGDTLYSNRSTALAVIVEDTVGVHDQLLAPCSRVMFERRREQRHRSCHENFTHALADFGIGSDDIVASFNVWMDVRVENNAVRIYPPPSVSGDVFSIRAEVDLIAAITACSSELTNDGICKPVAFEIEEARTSID